MSHSDFPLISCPVCKSKTLWNIFRILGRNVEQDQTMCCVQEWQLCLSYFWSYLPLLYYFDIIVIIHLILCLLCKSKTLWNIIMILGRNVEHYQTMCRVQEWQWQLHFSYFGRYIPLLCLTLIIHWFCVGCVSQRTFGIFFMILDRTRWSVMYKNDKSAFLTFGVISLCYIWQWLSIDIVSTL